MAGYTQLLVNRRQWEGEGSRTESNAEALAHDQIYTIYPKCILVIGNTAQLDNREKRQSFEAFRRNFTGLEVITFDELLGRARFIVDYSD